MGELDQKAFLDACKEKTAEDDEEKLALLCSKWEDEIRQPEWHPFKVIQVDGEAKVPSCLITSPVLFLCSFLWW
jgi:hypothetical protein